ncbi:MAG TPA: IclR family transcriptional regulator [Acidimicrobiia bacterium]
MSSAAPKTVLKAISLLNLVAANPDHTLSELSRLADMPAPTVLRLLRALQEESLVEVDRDGRYRLGVHCLVLGSTYLESFDLRKEARLELEALADEFDETVHLGVPDGIEVIYVDKVETSHSVRMYSRIGARSPMHSTGIGKAILAYAGDDLFQAVVEGGLPRRTPNTITDPDRLAEELERTRERGYSIDDIENEEGIRCAAAPVLSADGTPVAALSVSGPASRITEDRLPELGKAVTEVAERLSARLGYKRKDHA